MISKHYSQYRKERISVIESIGGEGKVIHSIVQFDEKRGRYFKYEITDNAVLIVKDKKEDYVITKMIARPSRIKKYWANAPKELIALSVKYTRDGLFI